MITYCFLLGVIPFLPMLLVMLGSPKKAPAAEQAPPAFRPPLETPRIVRRIRRASRPLFDGRLRLGAYARRAAYSL